METNKHKAPDSEQLTDEEICALMDSAEAARNKEDQSEAEDHILLAYDTLEYAMSSATSLPGPKVANDEKRSASRFDSAKLYQFSRSFARRKGVGVDAAILIQFLSEFSMSKGFRNPSTNLSFISITGEELADFLPWKSERTWQLVLHDIVHKGLIVSTQEFRKNNLDRTLAYAVPSEIQAIAAHDPVSFNAGEARNYGLYAAVLLEFLRTSLASVPADNQESLRRAMRPKPLADALPFSESSIKRAINLMYRKQLVLKQWNSEILAHEYWIAEKSVVL